MARARLKLQARSLVKVEQIIRFELMGKSRAEIAELMGMAVCSISELARHPEANRLRQALNERIYAPIDEEIRQRKANEVLHEASPDAA